MHVANFVTGNHCKAKSKFGMVNWRRYTFYTRRVQRHVPMEFRARDFVGEGSAASLRRVAAETHPLSPPCDQQADLVVHEKVEFFDPLRVVDACVAASVDSFDDEVNSVPLDNADGQLQAKEWISFKKILMQRFSGSKMVLLSTTSDVIIRSGKVHKKESTSMHLEELDDPQKYTEDELKSISQQEYLLLLRRLKDEITRAWQADDRVTSLKLSTKVARLLMDTSALQFYPALFVVATDVLDMLGDMVWQRIRQKAELSSDGNTICTLREKFEAKDICSDAKETCYNWFSKIGSVRELLPRIYLELAILPCWSFLIDHTGDVLRRLVMMARGVADPLAAVYCHLYMAHCAQKLSPSADTAYLILCIDDMKILLMRHLQETVHEKLSEESRLLVSLMEPAISYIVKCSIKDIYQAQAGYEKLGPGRNLSELLGKSPSLSIILHHVLKELPTELVTLNASEIFQHIGCCKDASFDQRLNYRLLGFRLSEGKYHSKEVNGIVDKVIEIVAEYESLDDYLEVVEAYLDMILQNQMDNHLNCILDGILKRGHKEAIVEIDLISLQSILIKLIAHFSYLEDIFSLPQFTEILDMMHGNSRDMVNMHILNIASRTGCIRDPTVIQRLFEVSQSLHNGIDFSNLKEDDKQQPARLISRFVNLVDYGLDLDRQLEFLVECRGAFSSIHELKEALVHSSNRVAVNGMKGGRHLSFVKSCLAFSEVTIPSVPSCAMQLNLYLETAEVALLGGLISYSDGLIDSAIFCLQTLSSMDGSRFSNDADRIIQLLRKLCSLLVLVPGKPEQGVTHVPRSILAAINSQSWMTPRMRTRVFCAIVSLAAALSQHKLPYHNEQVPSNDQLFFGDSTSLHDLLSLSDLVLQNLVDHITLEPSPVARGSMALEACNCIASSFDLNDEVLPIFSKLMEIAKSCLSSDDKYLQSTLRYVHKFLQKTKPVEAAG